MSGSLSAGAPVKASAFTGTGNGFSSNPTATVHYSVAGGMVVLRIDANITGTSNSTAFTLTGFPAEIYPAATQSGLVRLTDNGTAAVGMWSLATNGTMTFGKGVTGTGGFTNTGTKGLSGTTTIVYSLS